jgi:hypothetical protein
VARTDRTLPATKTGTPPTRPTVGHRGFARAAPMKSGCAKRQMCPTALSQTPHNKKLRQPRRRGRASNYTKGGSTSQGHRRPQMERLGGIWEPLPGRRLGNSTEQFDECSRTAWEAWIGLDERPKSEHHVKHGCVRRTFCSLRTDSSCIPSPCGKQQMPLLSDTKTSSHRLQPRVAAQYVERLPEARATAASWRQQQAVPLP